MDYFYPMPQPQRHVFVCQNTREEGNPKGSCTQRMAVPVFTKFREEIQKRGLMETIKVSKSGCLGPCAYGPTVVVYPDAVWYQKVSESDVAEIVEKHLIGNTPLERLRLDERYWKDR